MIENCLISVCLSGCLKKTCLKSDKRISPLILERLKNLYISAVKVKKANGILLELAKNTPLYVCFKATLILD